MSGEELDSRCKVYFGEKNAELKVINMIKAMFQHMINYQMQYHSSAIEHLTTLDKITYAFDEKAAAKVLYLFSQPHKKYWRTKALIDIFYIILLGQTVRIFSWKL